MNSNSASTEGSLPEETLPEHRAGRGSAASLLRRQWFFVQQRLFASFSFVLLDNRVSGRARAALLRWNGAQIGRRCFVRGGLLLQESFGLVLGDDVFINAGCCFDLSAPIVVGNRVQMAYQVTLITGGHDFGPHASRAGEHKPLPIQIGDGAWIGARATVMSGVTISAGAVVAAGALVTKDVLPDTVVAGVPAKPIRTLEP